MTKKIFLRCMILMLVILGCSACSKNGDASGSSEEGPVIPNIDWVEKIRTETVLEGTAIEKAVAEVVDIKLEDVTTEDVTITISSPDIGEELITWFDNIADDTSIETELQAEVLRLLEETERTELQVTLGYQVTSDEEVAIRYSDAYMSRVFCGMEVFYTYITNQVIDDLKEFGNEDM